MYDIVLHRELPQTRLVGRVCPTCGSSSWGTRNRCNVCRAKAQREAWAANPTAARAKDSARHRAWRSANPTKARAQKRRQLYALDVDAFEALLRAQHGRCAICGGARPTCVDHCHRTGAIRGLLCRASNTGLGQFGDDPDALVRAARYLEGGQET